MGCFSRHKLATVHSVISCTWWTEKWRWSMTAAGREMWQWERRKWSLIHYWSH